MPGPNTPETKIMRKHSKENVSKNKFLYCFRPVVDIDSGLHSRPPVHRSSDCRFACVPVAYKHEMKNPETGKSLFLDKYSEDSIMHHPPKRTLSPTMKAVPFETILNRRASRESRYSQDCFGLKRSYSVCTESSSAGDDKTILSQVHLHSVQLRLVHETKPESPLSSSSSSCSVAVSESNSLSKSYSTEAERRESSRQDTIGKQKRFDCAGLYLVLISLTFTVLWGTFLGGILTSTWFCFFCVWEASNRQPKEVTKSSKIESKARKE